MPTTGKLGFWPVAALAFRGLRAAAGFFAAAFFTGFFFWRPTGVVVWVSQADRP
ncbi:MAG: hypothetical protein ACE5FN_09975 [Leptospirillia bacterium]